MALQKAASVKTHGFSVFFLIQNMYASSDIFMLQTKGVL
jgi:hypothetical protein